MSDGPKQPRAVVLPAATALWEAIKPVCHKAALAGSLRRKEPRVGDVELVCYPLLEVGLVGEGDAYPQLAGVIAGLVARDVIRLDTKVKRNGPKYKRFVITELNDLPLEIYIASCENYGNILAIRTGPSAFSMALVSAAPNGFMPAGLRQLNGYLQRDDGTVVPCETEAEYFEALGIAPGPPEDRSITEVMRLKQVRAAVGRV